MYYDIAEMQTPNNVTFKMTECYICWHSASVMNQFRETFVVQPEQFLRAVVFPRLLTVD